jgi:hypothetical protein
VRAALRWCFACLTVLTARVGAAPPKPAPQKLAIVQTVLHDQREDAPAISSSYRYVAGEVLYLSYRVAGYTVKDDKVDLRWQMYMTDPDGLLLAPIESGAFKDEISVNDKDWLPRVDHAVPLPPQLYAGDYLIHLRVSDETAQVMVEQTVPFGVRGRAKEKLQSILIRGLRFYRGEDDPEPIDPVTYPPGSTLWARFEIAGYQIGEKNAFDVEYGLAVYRASGELLFEQPVAANEHDTPFYPKFWLMGGFNLSLGADLTPGEYTVKVQVRDKLAKTAGEQSATFQVRN